MRQYLVILHHHLLAVVMTLAPPVFLYDNTGHHKQLNLPTYPHHKHIGSDERIVSASAPDLTAVLDEVETLVQLPQ